MIPDHLQKEKWKKTNVSVSFFLLSCLILVFFTHPFLRLPYDPWEHLIKIRSLYDEGRCFLYWPEHGSSFWLWHLMWAKIFSFLNIDDTLLWAEIIHCTQFILSLLCVFYFSSIAYTLLVKKVSRSYIYLMAFFATVLWLVGNGTHSIDYQQAWIVWYSVTYQGFTIPIFWLITGFALQLFFQFFQQSH